MIAERLAEIRSQIPAQVQLVAVSKFNPEMCIRDSLTLQGDALRSSIDLTDLPEGSYIALIRTMQETFTQRVMIKRSLF